MYENVNNVEELNMPSIKAGGFYVAYCSISFLAENLKNIKYDWMAVAFNTFIVLFIFHTISWIFTRMYIIIENFWGQNIEN